MTKIIKVRIVKNGGLIFVILSVGRRRSERITSHKSGRSAMRSKCKTREVQITGEVAPDR